MRLPPLFSKLGMEFSLVLLGQAVSVVGSVVTVKLFTKILRPEIYGEVALLLTIANVAQLLVIGPLGQGCMRFFAPAHEAGELSSYFNAVFRLLVKGTVAILAAVVLGYSVLLLTGSYGLAELVALALSLSLVTSICSVFDLIQNAGRRRAVVAWHQALGQWLRLALVWLFVHLLGSTVRNVAIGFCISAILILISQAAFFYRTHRTDLHRCTVENGFGETKWLKLIKDYSLPFAIWGIGGWAQTASDRWALQANGVARDVGLYSVLYQLGYGPITLLSNLLIQLVSPILFARAGDGANSSRFLQARNLNNVLIASALGLTLLSVTGAFVFQKPLLSLLVAPDYQSVTPMLGWMVLAGGLFACGQVASLTLMSGNRTHSLVAPKIGIAIVALLANFAGAKWIGIGGVVAAMVLQGAAYFGWVLVINARVSEHAELAQKKLPS